MGQIKYVFTYGPSPSYRTRSSEHATLAEARRASYDKRCMGWSTSRIVKEVVEDDGFIAKMQQAISGMPSGRGVRA